MVWAEVLWVVSRGELGCCGRVEGCLVGDVVG